MTSTIARTPERGAAVLLPSHFQGRAARIGGVIGAVLPPAATTIVLAVIDGHVLPIAVLLGVVAVASAVAGYRLATTRIELKPDGMRIWSPFVRGRSIDHADVARVVVVTLFVRDSLKTVRSLYLVDAVGTTIRCIEGRYWPDPVLAAISKHFDVAHEVIPEPMTLPELRHARLVRLLWHQRHPALATLLTTAVIVVCSIAVTLVTRASV